MNLRVGPVRRHPLRHAFSVVCIVVFLVSMNGAVLFAASETDFPAVPQRAFREYAVAEWRASAFYWLAAERPGARAE
ncbi:hypothetical protein [Dickeya oryzae]